MEGREENQIKADVANGLLVKAIIKVADEAYGRRYIREGAKAWWSMDCKSVVKQYKKAKGRLKGAVSVGGGEMQQMRDSRRERRRIIRREKRKVRTKRRMNVETKEGIPLW